MKTSHRPRGRTVAVLALAAAASVGAFAQAAEPDRGRQMAAELKKRFTAADVNQDGFLSREEAKAGMPFVYLNFDAIDTARSGSLSMAAIAVFVRDKAAARKAGG